MLSSSIIIRRTGRVGACIATAILQRGYAFQAPLRDMRFLIDEVFDYQSHYKKFPGGDNANKEMVDMVFTEMAKFSEQVLSPLMQTSDSEGCKWINENTVKTPKGFKEAYDQFVEGGWQALSFPEKYGGQGLPPSMALFKSEMIATSNFTWGMFPGLSKGCINTILTHGSEELKNKYLPRLVSGKDTGTMCLTEPQCGSDLARVKTKAVPGKNNTYRITGTKIFISCGEHDMTENIIHCVLARLPGAPKGTKGISLFLVPKRIVKPNGEIGDLNHVNIGRIEDKMGCHGSPTCEINFENSVGYLIGEPNRGLNHMFTFINTSRLGTAIQGVSAAELSFQNALAYAKERVSMRSLTGTKCPDKEADPIIVHPDIRKMLLTQKAFSEGGRAMVYHCAKLVDEMHYATQAGDHKKAAALDDRLGFLTPILKGFLTEKGSEAANLGVQIWGGHGYIKSNLMEQIVRDVKIATVWEGTTGIQALDLLGRKIMLQKFRPLNEFIREINGFCRSTLFSSDCMSMWRYTKPMLFKTAQWRMMTWRIAMSAAKNKDWIGSTSVDYLMYSGYVTMGYFWMRQAH
eukprot:Ihof_evm10s35 gene=Ihof_evmTU10s35